MQRLRHTIASGTIAYCVLRKLTTHAQCVRIRTAGASHSILLPVSFLRGEVIFTFTDYQFGFAKVSLCREKF